jgi:hemerythrin-like domain-containing protein
MDTICEYLRFDHKRCDDLFDQTETSIAQRNWKDAFVHFRSFQDAMKQHIRMEEKVLFPVFEQVIHGSSGPISMLRLEHQQIRGIVYRMSDAIDRFNAADYALHAETLTLLMQQHTMKEEDMLYPLLDKALACKRASIIRAMEEFISPELGAAAG